MEKKYRVGDFVVYKSGQIVEIIDRIDKSGSYVLSNGDIVGRNLLRHWKHIPKEESTEAVKILYGKKLT